MPELTFGEQLRRDEELSEALDAAIESAVTAYVRGGGSPREVNHLLETWAVRRVTRSRHTIYLKQGDSR